MLNDEPIPTLTLKTDKICCCSAHFCIYYDSTYAIIEHDDNYFKWRTSSSCSCSSNLHGMGKKGTKTVQRKMES